MKPFAIATILLLLLYPLDAPAFKYQRSEGRRIGTGSHNPSVAPVIRGRTVRSFNADHRFTCDGRPGHRPGRPVYKPSKRKRCRPINWYPVATTVVRESAPVIVINQPPEPEPVRLPEPKKVWVPPVMATRTEPGFWDYGVKKVWMGDHWRFEQNLEEKNWVPETVVEYVKQEGHWKFVE